VSGAMLPLPGLYPEQPIVRAVPDAVFCVQFLEPIIQVTTFGVILCCPGWKDWPDPPWSEGTSVSELLPMRKEGPWTTGSYVHDLAFAMGICWELRGGCLIERVLKLEEADRAWAEGHWVKRETAKASRLCTALHYRGLRLGSWAAWNHYRANEAKNADRLCVLRGVAGEAVDRFVTMGDGGNAECRVPNAECEFGRKQG